MSQSLTGTAEARQQSGTRDDFNLGIHGARGLFSFSILIYHVHNSGLPSWDLPSPVAFYFESLRYGVELFFGISGFVILGTMFRSKTPGQFILNRATRILPVLWTAVLVVVAMSLISGREAPATYDPLQLLVVTIGNMMALPGIFPVPLFLPPAWSLSYEFTFYVLCYFYLVGMQRWNVRLLWPLVAVGLAIVAFNPRGLFFLPGLVVAAGLLDDRRLDAISRFPIVWMLVFLGAWSMSGTPQSPFFTTVFDWSLVQWGLAAIALLSATILMRGIAMGQGLLGLLLKTPVMLWLGTISYSLYLWHPILLGVLKPVLRALGVVDLLGPASQLAFLLVAVGPSLLIAHLSQIYLEKGVTTYLRRRTKRVPAAAE